MARANPIRTDVKGAPFSIGESVRIIAGLDETQDKAFVGLSGQVVSLEYECGSGQTFPEDPMIGVCFDNRTEEEFWKEELQRI